MLTLTLLTALSALTLTTAQEIIAPDLNIPEGFQVGYASQDYEPPGQQSICTTNCELQHPFPSTAGPNPLPPGVWAAAIPPSLGGGSDDCGPCGSCYRIVQSGVPYCAPGDGGCGAPSGPIEQRGPKEIKILITNHCTDCDNVPGHFDINNAPAGWNNPRVYWQRVGDEECL